MNNFVRLTHTLVHTLLLSMPVVARLFRLHLKTMYTAAKFSLLRSFPISYCLFRVRVCLFVSLFVLSFTLFHVYCCWCICWTYLLVSIYLTADVCWLFQFSILFQFVSSFLHYCNASSFTLHFVGWSYLSQFTLGVCVRCCITIARTCICVVVNSIHCIYTVC